MSFGSCLFPPDVIYIDPLGLPGSLVFANWWICRIEPVAVDRGKAPVALMFCVLQVVRMLMWVSCIGNSGVERAIAACGVASLNHRFIVDVTKPEESFRRHQQDGD